MCVFMCTTTICISDFVHGLIRNLPIKTICSLYHLLASYSSATAAEVGTNLGEVVEAVLNTNVELVQQTFKNKAKINYTLFSTNNIARAITFISV